MTGIRMYMYADKLSSKSMCMCSIRLPVGSLFFSFWLFRQLYRTVAKRRTQKRQLSSTIGRSLIHAGVFLFLPYYR